MYKAEGAAMIFVGTLLLLLLSVADISVESDPNLNYYTTTSLLLIVLGIKVYKWKGNSEDSDTVSQDTGICPYCYEKIHINAKVCKHCKSDTENKVKPITPNLDQNEEITHPDEKYTISHFTKEIFGNYPNINIKTLKIIATSILPNHPPEDLNLKKLTLKTLKSIAKQKTTEKEKIGFIFILSLGLIATLFSFIIGAIIIIGALYFKNKNIHNHRTKIINDIISANATIQSIS